MMTMPVDQSWSVNPSFRNRRRWFGLNAVVVAYLAAALDFLVLLLASTGGYTLYQLLSSGVEGDLSLSIGTGLLVATVFVLTMAVARAYEPASMLSFRRQAAAVCAIFPAVLVFLLAVIFFLKVGTAVSRGAILSGSFLSFGTLVVLRLMWRSYLNKAASLAAFPTRRLLLMCADNVPVEPIIQKAALNGFSIRHTMHIAHDGGSAERLAKQGVEDIDEVLILWDGYSNPADVAQCLFVLRTFCVPVSVMFNGVVGDIAQGVPQDIGERRAFQIHRPPLGAVERSIKRSFDIVFSIAALTVLFPICVAVVVAIKLDSRGPVFFTQSRKGYGGRPFRIVKFRSMSVMEDAADVRQVTRNDPRVTRVGAFIRSTSVDELPQFWNVLRGDMSVVGPRPHAMAHDDLYDTLIAQYASRRHVKPGLTGWAQVNGHRGETPTIEKMADRVRHDIWYINNWSLWLDLRIVFRTAHGLKDRSNVY